MIKSKNTEQLINDFVKFAIEDGVYKKKGDYKKDDKLQIEINKIAVNLKQQESGREAIARLMEHEDFYVRFWAASFSLKDKTKKAIKVLGDLMKSEELVSFDARAMLHFWEQDPSKFS